MENINFKLTELESTELESTELHPIELNPTDFDSNLTLFYPNNYYDIEQLKLYYNTNYTIKTLLQILQYYGLQKNKMVKEEIIQVLLFFETDPANKLTVEKRLRLWNNIQELKADSYFSKYILF